MLENQHFWKSHCSYLLLCAFITHIFLVLEGVVRFLGAIDRRLYLERFNRLNTIKKSEEFVRLCVLILQPNPQLYGANWEVIDEFI